MSKRTAASRSIEPKAGDHRVGLLEMMVLIRRFEERCAQLYSESKIRGFMHLYIGEEAISTGVCAAITPDDNVVATYREHGHALARGITPEAIMAEMFGRVEGCSHGRGGSMHLFDAEHRFFGGNAIVAGGLPVAIGLALADHLRKAPRITMCFFGEGAVAEGEFHECMNLAALWHLPIVFCCENNLYAMGTALARSESDVDLTVKAAGYNMAAWAVDGMDVDAVERAAQQAVLSTRGGGGPTFLEMRTYRFRAHSMYDPELYRTKEEVAKWRERDPIDMFVARLQREGLLDEAALAEIEARVAAAVDAAIEFADAGTFEDVRDLTRHVYAEAPR
ncbi:MAG: pyruvate dehydrogenase (acetyl-transferring) E1 component subunit alpha [Ilumatobacteraceae bacterium]